MSFSSNVKEELSGKISPARHCQIAEIAAILSLCGRIQISENDHCCIKMHTENAAVARKYQALLKEAFRISADVSIRQSVPKAASRGSGEADTGRRNRIYTVGIRRHADAVRVLMAAKLMDTSGEIAENLSVSKNVVIQKRCCRRAFLRGAFLAAGSISDPERFYHYEIACATEAKAEQLKKILETFELDARIIRRKKYFVVYIKEGSQIVDVLNVMDAPRSLMELENIRIVKEMRGSVNRKVNCEMANLGKTVTAAVRQTDDIICIRDTIGFGRLPENLQEIAALRLANPDATLKELGEALNPQVGKSGVNHRLRKLGEIAQRLREQRPDGNR